MKKAGDALNEWERKKPSGYSSKYQERLDGILGSILERGDFKYSLNADPLYRQYREQYIKNGERAMEDTVGKVSALSGGYGSSYAATAGMQSYSNELSKLNSVALDLRDRAYSVYKDKGDALYDAASLLRSLDGDDYKKYRDTVSDYYSDGDYLYKKLKNMSDSEYEKFLDEVKAWENDRKFSYEQYIDETERMQYEEGMAFKREEAKRQQANADRNYALALKKLYSSASSGGSSKKSSSKKSSSGDSKADYPRTYGEFVKETGKSNIMTEKEFSLRENAIKSYGDYESYLKKMYAKYKD